MILQLWSYGLLISFWMLHLIKMISTFHNQNSYNIIPSGRGKQVYIEVGMKVVLLVITCYQLVLFYNNDVAFIIIDIIWIVLGVFANIGFAICMITMKKNWHSGIKENKADQLVTTGIYQYSRNPAYVCLYGLYIALALLQNDILLYCLSALLIIMIHQQVLQEEVFLQKTFSKEYQEYFLKTSRYF